MKEKLLDLYIAALEEASVFYLSDYCTSNEEAKERLKEDEEAIEYFKALLNRL